MKQVHVIGAGLAGLSAALSLTAAGWSVSVHEAGPAAGGRCRSYMDKELGLRIDNGNHLMLTGNVAAAAYIAEIGAQEFFDIPRQAVFPFVDIGTGERWAVRPNNGRIPWWVLRENRRVPETRLSDYWRMARLGRVRDDSTVADAMRRGRLYWRLVDPLATAALNTPPQGGLARLLGTVMRETLLRGGKACRPMLPKAGLSQALIDPAVATLRARGADMRFNSRIAELRVEDGKVTMMRGPAGPIEIAPGDAVVLAAPPWIANDLLPELTVPDAFEAILNIHFRYDPPVKGPAAEAGFIAMTSAKAHWLFVKPGHLSVTISAANNMAEESAEAIAAMVWPDVVNALGLRAGTAMPPFRVVKEKRATFAATAQQEALRPNGRTDLAANLALAGDWTDTGLPATIEGAIRSGRFAADVVLSI